jgi:hypothetical protein
MKIKGKHTQDPDHFTLELSGGRFPGTYVLEVESGEVHLLATTLAGAIRAMELNVPFDFEMNFATDDADPG